MSRTRKVLIALLTVAVVAGGAGAAWWYASDLSQGTGAAAEQAVRVEATLPTVGSISVQSEFVGTADPGRQVTIYPKATGEVLEVNFKAGDTVREGDVLVKLDSKALETSIAQTQAALASAQAKANLNLEMAEKNLNTTEYNMDEGYDAALIQAEKAVETAEANLKAKQISADNTRRDIRDLRDDKLQVPDGTVYDDYIVAKQRELAQYEIALESAQIGLEQAQESLRSILRQKEDQKDSISDSIEMARLNSDFSDQHIALQKLRDDLANYSVKSQISGVIEQCNVELYDMASPQSPLFVISDKDAMTVKFSVAESALDHIREGDEITVEKNGETATGEITEISTMVDARSGLYTVKARVEDVPFSMHSGSTVKVFADTRKVENDLLIPIDAIYYEAGKPYVYVAEGGAAKKIYITTGIADSELIQILSGLTGAEQIITSWSSSLGDGVTVEVVAAAQSEDTPQTEGAGA